MALKYQQKKSFVENFDICVERSLIDLGVNLNSSLRLGIAASGGADSTALLTSLFHLAIKKSFSLLVVTVNHRIRNECQSLADVQFVLNHCEQLKKQGLETFVDSECEKKSSSLKQTKNVCFDCSVRTLAYGQVFEEAKRRSGGVEEAARFLRYKEFNSFIEEKKLDFLCLAHNQNDQVETLVMRFLQGSSSVGIKPIRDVFIRPLLQIERKDIEQYLIEQNISWQTDSTNFDTSYFRNKIRNLLIPQLDSLVPGWKKSVLQGAEKSFEDLSTLESFLPKLSWQSVDENTLFVPMNKLFSMDKAFIRRHLYLAINKLGYSSRVPYQFIKNCFKIAKSPFDDEKKVCFSDIQARIKDGLFFIEKQKKTATYTSFFDIIKKSGIYVMPFGILCAENSGKVRVKKNGNICLLLKEVSFPFCVRSRQADDKILTSDSNFKSINDVFSSWAVTEADRDLIPVFQELNTPNQSIFCICGSVYGYDNWIVKS